MNFVFYHINSLFNKNKMNILAFVLNIKSIKIQLNYKK